MVLSKRLMFGLAAVVCAFAAVLLTVAAAIMLSRTVIQEPSNRKSETAPTIKDQATYTDRWSGEVSATNARGVTATQRDGRSLNVSVGDEIEIQVTGFVKVGIDRPTVGPEGETTGYWDYKVDSPFHHNVGGLEMWIGPGKNTNRYLVGSQLKQKVDKSGTITFRVIDSLTGYKGTGSFSVTLTKASSSPIESAQSLRPSSKEVKVPANVMWFDTGINVTGKRIRIEYVSGEWKNSPTSGSNTGEGRSPYAEQSSLIVPSANLSSLVGKTESGTFYVGNSYEGSPGRGKLLLSMNDKQGMYDDNIGALTVRISFAEN